MKHLFRRLSRTAFVLVACCWLMLLSAPARAENAYVMELNYGGIYSVDVNSGGPATLLLQLPGGKQGYTLATRPSDGMLFFLDSNATNPNLWRWDPSNPAVAPVLLGTPGATANIVRLGFDAAGNLLAMDTSTTIWTLDTSSGGIITTIALNGDLPTNSGDLCLDSTTGVLYMVATNELYTVGATGISTLLGTVTGTANFGNVTGWLTGCAFTRNGTLLVSVLGGGALYKVNVGGLVATALAASTGIGQIGDLSTAPLRTADLSVSKVASDPTPGTTATFTVTVTNAGPDAATDVRVLDPVPAGLTFAASTPSQGAYSSTALTVGGNTFPAGTWRVGRLAAGASATLSMTYTVSGTLPITNTAQVSYSDPYDPDSIPGNSAAGEDDQASVSITPSPDLQVSKTANSSFAVGNNGVYQISVRNASTVATSGTYTVTDTLPAGLTFVSATGTNWTCAANTPVGANVAGGSLMSCTSATSLGSGATSAPITLTVSVGAAAAPSVTNTASVSGGGEPASNSGNNSGSATTPVCGSNCPDLVVNKSVSASPLTVGTNATYTLSVTNRGGLATSAAYTLTDVLPAGLTIATLPTGAGWVCTGVIGTATVSCNGSGPLAAGATSASVTFQVAVAAGAFPQVVNKASVTGGGEPPATQGNNSISLATPVQDFDLTVTKVKATAANFQVGANADYTITVNNIGARASVGATTVSDTLPTGMTLTGAPTGTGWICTGAAGGTSFTCTSATGIAANASSNPITVPVVAGGAAAPSVTNTATVSNPSEQSAYAGNNASTVTTPVDATDLVLTKSHNGTFSVGGNNNQYTLTVTNIGALASSGTITVADNLPTGITLAAVPNATGWTCTANNPVAGANTVGGSVVSCSRNTALAPNASLPPITLTVLAAAAAYPSVTNTATVSGGGQPSGNTGNDSDSDVTPVYYPPTFGKAFNPASAQAGTLVQLKFTITNSANGPATLQGISFVDNLPASMTVASPPGLSNTCGGTILAGSQTGNTQVALSGGSITGVGASCTITVNVLATTVTTLNNTTSELATSNGGTAAAATASLAVLAPTSPILSKVTSPNPIGLGEPSTLTFRITNKSTATNGIGFTDTLPANVIAVAPATFTNGCGGTPTYTAPAGVTPAKIALTGVNLAISANCTISIRVTSNVAGSYPNISTNITNLAGGLDNSKVSDTLLVQQSALTKTFSPASIYIGGTSTMSFVLTNTPETPEFNGIGFTETLPPGLVLAAAPAATQCNAAVTGVAGGNTVKVTGAILAAAQASCTITAVVTSGTAATYNNIGTNVTGVSANLVNNVNASLLVQASLPSLTKTVTVLNDPVNGTTNAKAIPGAEVLYTITVVNQGPVVVDANSLVLTDSVPVNTSLYVGNLGSPNGPIGFTASTSPPAGLTFTYTSLGDATDDVSFSSTAAAPYAFTYTPVPDASGYDPAVTAIRLNPKGSLAGAASAPFAQVQFQFKAKVR